MTPEQQEALHQTVYNVLYNVSRWELGNLPYIGGFEIEYTKNKTGSDFELVHCSGGGKDGPPWRKVLVLKLRLEYEEVGGRILIDNVFRQGVVHYTTSLQDLLRLGADVRQMLVGYIRGWLNAITTVPQPA